MSTAAPVDRVSRPGSRLLADVVIDREVLGAMGPTIRAVKP